MPFELSRVVVLGALAALGSACSPGIVLARTASLELNGGVTAVHGKEGEPLARSGAAWNLGFTINVEFEASPSLRIGVGGGYTNVRLPAKGAIPSHSIGSIVAHVWFEVPLRETGRSFVPRVALGGTVGGNGVVRTAYLGFGGAFPSGPTSVHVTTGPQVLAVDDQETNTHSGWGWQARIRLRRTLFSDCSDVKGSCD